MLFLSMSSCSQLPVPATRRGSAWHTLPSCRKATATVAAAAASDNSEDCPPLMDHDAMYTPFPQQICSAIEENQSCDGDMGCADDATGTSGDDEIRKRSSPLLRRVWDPLTHACASDDPTHWTPFSLPPHAFPTCAADNPGGGPAHLCTAAPLSLASEPKVLEECRCEASSCSGSSKEALQMAAGCLRSCEGAAGDVGGSVSPPRRCRMPAQRRATKEVVRLKVVSVSASDRPLFQPLPPLPPHTRLLPAFLEHAMALHSLKCPLNSCPLAFTSLDLAHVYCEMAVSLARQIGVTINILPFVDPSLLSYSSSSSSLFSCRQAHRLLRAILGCPGGNSKAAVRVLAALCHLAVTVGRRQVCTQLMQDAPAGHIVDECYVAVTDGPQAASCKRTRLQMELPGEELQLREQHVKGDLATQLQRRSARPRLPSKRYNEEEGVPEHERLVPAAPHFPRVCVKKYRSPLLTPLSRKHRWALQLQQLLQEDAATTVGTVGSAAECAWHQPHLSCCSLRSDSGKPRGTSPPSAMSAVEDGEEGTTTRDLVSGMVKQGEQPVECLLGGLADVAISQAVATAVESEDMEHSSALQCSAPTSVVVEGVRRGALLPSSAVSSSCSNREASALTAEPSTRVLCSTGGKLARIVELQDEREVHDSLDVGGGEKGGALTRGGRFIPEAEEFGAVVEGTQAMDVSLEDADALLALSAVAECLLQGLAEGDEREGTGSEESSRGGEAGEEGGKRRRRRKRSKGGSGEGRSETAGEAVSGGRKRKRLGASKGSKQRDGQEGAEGGRSPMCVDARACSPDVDWKVENNECASARTHKLVFGTWVKPAQGATGGPGAGRSADAAASAATAATVAAGHGGTGQPQGPAGKRGGSRRKGASAASLPAVAACLSAAEDSGLSLLQAAAAIAAYGSGSGSGNGAAIGNTATSAATPLCFKGSSMRAVAALARTGELARFSSLALAHAATNTRTPDVTGAAAAAAVPAGASVEYDGREGSSAWEAKTNAEAVDLESRGENDSATAVVAVKEEEGPLNAEVGRVKVESRCPSNSSSSSSSGGCSEGSSSQGESCSTGSSVSSLMAGEGGGVHSDCKEKASAGILEGQQAAKGDEIAPLPPSSNSTVVTGDTTPSCVEAAAVNAPAASEPKASSAMPSSCCARALPLEHAMRRAGCKLRPSKCTAEGGVEGVEMQDQSTSEGKTTGEGQANGEKARLQRMEGVLEHRGGQWRVANGLLPFHPVLTSTSASACDAVDGHASQAAVSPDCLLLSSMPTLIHLADLTAPQRMLPLQDGSAPAPPPHSPPIIPAAPSTQAGALAAACPVAPSPMTFPVPPPPHIHHPQSFHHFLPPFAIPGFHLPPPPPPPSALHGSKPPSHALRMHHHPSPPPHPFVPPPHFFSFPFMCPPHLPSGIPPHHHPHAGAHSSPPHHPPPIPQSSGQQANMQAAAAVAAAAAAAMAAMLPVMQQEAWMNGMVQSQQQLQAWQMMVRGHLQVRPQLTQQHVAGQVGEENRAEAEQAQTQTQLLPDAQTDKEKGEKIDAAQGSKGGESKLPASETQTIRGRERSISSSQEQPVSTLAADGGSSLGDELCTEGDLVTWAGRQQNVDASRGYVAYKRRAVKDKSSAAAHPPSSPLCIASDDEISTNVRGAAGSCARAYLPYPSFSHRLFPHSPHRARSSSPKFLAGDLPASAAAPPAAASNSSGVCTRQGLCSAMMNCCEGTKDVGGGPADCRNVPGHEVVIMDCCGSDNAEGTASPCTFDVNTEMRVRKRRRSASNFPRVADGATQAPTSSKMCRQGGNHSSDSGSGTFAREAFALW